LNDDKNDDKNEDEDENEEHDKTRIPTKEGRDNLTLTPGGLTPKSSLRLNHSHQITSNHILFMGKSPASPSSDAELGFACTFVQQQSVTPY